jgi:hypothetical protein
MRRVSRPASQLSASSEALHSPTLKPMTTATELPHLSGHHHAIQTQVFANGFPDKPVPRQTSQIDKTSLENASFGLRSVMPYRPLRSPLKTRGQGSNMAQFSMEISKYPILPDKFSVALVPSRRLFKIDLDRCGLTFVRPIEQQKGV